MSSRNKLLVASKATSRHESDGGRTVRDETEYQQGVTRHGNPFSDVL